MITAAAFGVIVLTAAYVMFLHFYVQAKPAEDFRAGELEWIVAAVRISIAVVIAAGAVIAWQMTKANL